MKSVNHAPSQNSQIGSMVRARLQARERCKLCRVESSTRLLSDEAANSHDPAGTEGLATRLTACEHEQERSSGSRSTIRTGRAEAADYHGAVRSVAQTAIVAMVPHPGSRLIDRCRFHRFPADPRLLDVSAWASSDCAGHTVSAQADRAAARLVGGETGCLEAFAARVLKASPAGTARYGAMIGPGHTFSAASASALVR